MALPERSDSMVFRALKRMGYSAVGIGPTEVGPALDRYLQAANQAGVTVVQIDTKDRDGVVPYIIRDIAGVRMGVVSFGYVQDDNTGLEARKKRYAAYKEAREKSDFLVLMNAGSVVDDSLLSSLSDRYGPPDVIIGGSYATKVFGNGRIVGKTHILPITLEGKHVGLLDIVFETGKDPQMNCSDATLEESMAQEPTTQKELEAYFAAEPRQPASPTSGEGNSGTKTSGVYYSSKACEDCHKSEYDSWMTTKHSAAVNTLVNEKRDVPACMTCHSERYRQTDDYLPVNEAFRRGVECASCHIRVLPHGHEGPSKDLKGSKIDLDTCRVCHTKERSPDFEPNTKTYWERVKHPAPKPS
jgi:hypothetical protein